jgi:hypothetical protein
MSAANEDSRTIIRIFTVNTIGSKHAIRNQPSSMDDLPGSISGRVYDNAHIQSYVTQPGKLS